MQILSAKCPPLSAIHDILAMGVSECQGCQRKGKIGEKISVWKVMEF